MSDETTPLTSGIRTQQSSLRPPLPSGPAVVFPGGVSLRSRRRKMLQFQWCLGVTFLLILIAALIVALALSSSYNRALPAPVLLAVNKKNATDAVAEKATATARATATAARERLAAIKAPLADEREADWALGRLHLNHSSSEQAINAGIKALGDRELLEEGLQAIPPNSPAFRHYRSLSTSLAARKLTRRGYVENHATRHLAERFNYSRGSERSNIGRGPSILLPDPTSSISCDFNSRYRRADGACNNRAHPRQYGASLIPYRRMVAPDYADGVAAPRGSLSLNGSSALPTAREVSVKIHRASYETDSNFTAMLAVFGQFLDHDITATSQSTSQEGESINCCAAAAAAAAAHPECFPVPIAADDPFYGQFNVSCMNFVRSSPAPTGHFGPRQQLNQATSFIDGSVVYGNSDDRQRHLRSMTGGRLRMFATADGRELLPLSTNLDDGCNRVRMLGEGKYCFESGDDRANENLLLTSMHLLWARHHNYLADSLQAENPDWDDETVFQEARRLLAAQMAHITYNEFLPILLGRDLAAKKGLLPHSDDWSAADTYDPLVDPSIANCFASAAFRFAHTLLPDLLNATANISAPEVVELHKMLFNPFSLWTVGGIDSALIGASNTPVRRVDRFFSLEVTQKLFEGTAEDHLPICGLDLVSLNIQRGRDHGLPAYPVFRRHCHLPPTDTWEQMAAAVDADTLTSIRQIYKSPLDVDVYTGALSEPPLEGAIFGPLLTCLISDQFLRLKRGDSHWYERKSGPQRFTNDQLREIYKSTLSAVICHNSDAVRTVRKYVMLRYTNAADAYVECADVRAFNFTPWNARLQGAVWHAVHVGSAASKVRPMRPPTAANHSSAGDEDRPK